MNEGSGGERSREVSSLLDGYLQPRQVTLYVITPCFELIRKEKKEKER